MLAESLIGNRLSGECRYCLFYVAEGNSSHQPLKYSIPNVAMAPNRSAELIYRLDSRQA